MTQHCAMTCLTICSAFLFCCCTETAATTAKLKDLRWTTLHDKTSKQPNLPPVFIGVVLPLNGCHDCRFAIYDFLNEVNDHHNGIPVVFFSPHVKRTSQKSISHSEIDEALEADFTYYFVAPEDKTANILSVIDNEDYPMVFCVDSQSEMILQYHDIFNIPKSEIRKNNQSCTKITYTYRDNILSTTSQFFDTKKR